MIRRKGQIAIFVIVGLILVAAITFVFLAFGGPKIVTSTEFEPQQFIDKCIKESVRETVDVMIPQGGFVNPTDYKIYNNIKAAYLCKNINYYEPCVTQYPLYLSKLEEEIEENIRDDIEACFLGLEDELRKRNYEVSGGEIEINAVLKPEIIEITVLRDFSFNKGD